MGWFWSNVLPTITVYSPILFKDKNTGNNICIGLNKNNNSLWLCYIKPGKPSLIRDVAPILVNVDPICWIKAKKSGGILISILTPSNDISVLEFELLESGELYYSSRSSRSVINHNPEKKPFEKQGHPDFDLLERLFV